MIPVATVLVTAANGRWVYLDQLGTVSGLQWTWEFPGGATSAACSLGFPPNRVHPALVTGADVQIMRGVTSVWRGRLTGITRGDPWQFEFEGTASIGGNEVVTTTGVPNVIVDALIADGLAWSRPASLGGLKWDNAEGGIGKTTLAEVLNQSLAASDLTWRVSSSGVLTSAPEPTVASVMLRSAEPLNATMNDFGTVVKLRYRTSAANDSTTTITRPAAGVVTPAIAKWGRKVHTVDAGDRIITAFGVASQLADKYLAKVAPRLQVTRDFTCNPGDITTYRGGRVDLASANLAGQVAQIQAPSMSRDSAVIPSVDVTMLIGATEYNADDGTLTVSPDQRTATPAEIMFGGKNGSRTS